MKQTIIILIISIILIFVSIVLYRVNINRNSILTCTRMNDDVVVIKFNRDGIEGLKINGKDVNSKEFLLYQTNFLGKFTWIQMYAEDYTELELIQEYMKYVAEYEKNNKKYKSVCVQQ